MSNQPSCKSGTKIERGQVYDYIERATCVDCGYGEATVATIPVTNHSFEEPVVTTIPGFGGGSGGPYCTSTTCPSIPGWEFSGIAGLLLPNSLSFPPEALDGDQVAYSDSRSNGEAFATQTVPDFVYQPNLDYKLTVSIGNRLQTEIPFGDGVMSLF